MSDSTLNANELTGNGENTTAPSQSPSENQDAGQTQSGTYVVRSCGTSNV